MEELDQLKEHIRKGELDLALELIEDMDEMSRSGNIRIIRKQTVRLMSHLIKRSFEQRMTTSWRASIADAARQVDDVNQSRETSKSILSNNQLHELMEDSFEDAIYDSLVEIDGGRRKVSEILDSVDENSIISDAMTAVYDRKTFLEILSQEIK